MCFFFLLWLCEYIVLTIKPLSQFAIYCLHSECSCYSLGTLKFIMSFILNTCLGILLKALVYLSIFDQLGNWKVAALKKHYKKRRNKTLDCLSSVWWRGWSWFSIMDNSLIIVLISITASKVSWLPPMTAQLSWSVYSNCWCHWLRCCLPSRPQRRPCWPRQTVRRSLASYCTHWRKVAICPPAQLLLTRRYLGRTPTDTLHAFRCPISVPPWGRDQLGRRE